MNKILMSGLIATSLLVTSATDQYSTTAVVTLVGGRIAASATDVIPVKKYKRKDCPVCKGKGWYISGDGIAKVSCGYCEPENSDISKNSIKHQTHK